jgi:drug/metabolite transporter (DMT)-like permease
VALGLLSFAGLGFIGSVTADIIFLSVAVAIASIAIWHGIRKHHSYKPALVFVMGLVFVVLGHFVIHHEHTTSHPLDPVDIVSTFFSVGGGLCFVLFHVLNLRMGRSCGCKHCSTGH